jgi:anti-sigma B factor antagonist
MAFAIDTVARGRNVVVEVRGDVDIATAAALAQRLADTLVTARAVVVDLAGVGFMDSTGLGVLVAAFHHATAAGGTLVLARPQRIVRNALRLLQVDAVVDVYDSLDDALA